MWSEKGPLAVAEVVRRSRAVLHPVDADHLLAKVDLIPLQVDQLARPQPVPICDQDCRRVPMPITGMAASDRHQLLDLGFGEALTRTALTNCPVFRGGRLRLDHDLSPILPISANVKCHI